MAVIVYDEGWKKEYRTQRGDRYFVDDQGNLHVETQYHEQIAVFAKGRWTRAKVEQSRDKAGRFIPKARR